jgi:ADP-ribose pyrophosphatase
MSARELEVEHIHKGRILNLRRARVTLPGGKETVLELMDHPGASAVVPLDGGEVLLIRQYRHAADGWLWEIPAGTLEPDEHPDACARRELEEEAGVRAASLHPLGFIFTAPGFVNERIHIYLAEGLTPAPTNLDDDEVIEEVRRVPLSEAIAMIERGEITDAKTTVGLLRVARLRASGEASA